jgi:xylulokinase
MLLGLDLGTTNVKALAVEPDGRIVASGSAPVPTYHVGPGGVEQDIEEVWSAALSAVAEAGESADLDRVVALGVSSQGGALQVLDAEGRPVGRVVSWLDGRGAPYNRAVTAELGEEWLADHTGHGAAGLAVGQILRLREAEPGLVEAPAGVGFVGDVIVGRLCGRRAHDATSLSIAGLLNPELGAAEPELLARVGVAEGQLPDLLRLRTPAGTLGDSVAGLGAGIPVSAAVHDQYAAALGAGAVHAGDVMFGAGTAWVLLAAVAADSGTLRPVIPRAFACTHLVEGLYGQMVSMVNGGSAFRWAAEILGLSGQRREQLDKMMASVAPGSDGVRFRPLLAPGGGTGLRPGTRGRLDGLGLSHGAAHVLRAAVEGLVMEFARHLQFLLEAGIEVERLAMCGGGALSRLTPQVLADTAGLPVACVTEGEVSALGAAVIARGLAEPEQGLDALAEKMCPPVRLHEPGEHRGFYQEMREDYIASLPLAEAEEPS